MSKKTLDIPEARQEPSAWAALLEETNTEINASTELTVDEKRLLDQLDALTDSEWEPVVCSGKPVSQTIIEDRGER